MNAQLQPPRPPDAASHSAFQPFVREARPRSWRWTDLCVSLAMAGGLAASWLWPPGRALWNQIDETMFRLANNALSFEWWQSGWAVLNHRWCDLAGIGLFGALVLYAGMSGGRSLRRSAISFALLALAVMTLSGATHVLLTKGKPELQRPSPTLVHADALRLGELVPSIEAKDSSPWSFPSDHGFIVLTVVLYLGYRGPDLAVKLGTVLALAYTIPRLVAGAHWFSDLAVGSVVLALVATSVLMATPLHDWFVDRVDRLFSARSPLTVTASPQPAELRQRVAPTAIRQAA